MWDDELARMAALWTDGCIWAHGQPDVPTAYIKIGNTTGNQDSFLCFESSQ